MKFKFILLSIAVLLLLSCSEELDISEFSDDFAEYESELRIEAIILPTDSSAIVRIDRSILIDEAELYNCIDDDGDWVEEDHDDNGNGRPDPGETNVDEPDEGRIREKNISLFPIIPTIGFTWEF